MALLLENATLVTLDPQRPVLGGQQLLVDRGVIAGMGSRIMPAGFAAEKRIDCSGKSVMPGLVNAHSHLAEILQRSRRDNVRMDVIHQLVFCRAGRCVETVLVDGEIVVAEGRLTRVDEETLIRRAGETGKKISRLYSSIKKRSGKKASAIAALYDRVPWEKL